jgi:hypothetical protein
MLPADLETLKEIAQQLSGRGVGEWVVEERGFNVTYMIGPDKIAVEVCRSSNMWTFTERLPYMCRDIRTVKINVYKPPGTIARELKRRLVDGVLQAFTEAKEKEKLKEEERDHRRRIIAELAAIIEYVPATALGTEFVTGSPHEGKRSVRCSAWEHGVNLTLYNITPEKAKKLLELYKSWQD